MNDRMKLDEFIKWLQQFPITSEIAFLINGKGPGGIGTSYDQFEIRERKLSTGGVVFISIGLE